MVSESGGGSLTDDSSTSRSEGPSLTQIEDKSRTNDADFLFDILHSSNPNWFLVPAPPNQQREEDPIEVAQDRTGPNLSHSRTHRYKYDPPWVPRPGGGQPPPPTPIAINDTADLTLHDGRCRHASGSDGGNPIPASTNAFRAPEARAAAIQLMVQEKICKGRDVQKKLLDDFDKLKEAFQQSGSHAANKRDHSPA